MAGRQRNSVMLSSTFLDLREHRKIAAEALEHAKLFPERMEPDGPRPGLSVIESSYRKVDDAAGYLLLLGRRYGEPEISPRNPDFLSTTHLEFNRALESGIPVAVIALGDDYPLPAFEETDAIRAKRDVLRKAAKGLGVYSEVGDIAAFSLAAVKAAFALRDAIAARETIPEASRDPVLSRPEELPPPAPPAYYAARPFAQGMDFVGRDDDLAKITAWATSDDAMMVIEAIGGMGKSMLTHHWATNYATAVRPDFVGRMWYSFYEAGADMADFCRHALAYMEKRPVKDFAKHSTREMADSLVGHLQSQPWLVVMDGAERLLRAYARVDRAGLRSEASDAPLVDADDKKTDTNLCLRPDDDNILRALTRCGPSKLLLSTRNMPTALLNVRAPRKGMHPERLHGLTGQDALRLMREAGIRGDAASIVGYLERHFGGHPLMIGVVAGLISEHARAPGDFDDWLRHPLGGRDLDLAKIEGLVGKREHILKVALDGLGSKERMLLGSLALFSHAVRYEIVEAVAARLLKLKRAPGAELQRAELVWISTTMIDLRRRGLVIADGSSYDLHPLVRAFIRHSQNRSERTRTADAVVDFARSQAPAAIGPESTRDELDRYFDVVEALLLAGKPSEAADLLGHQVTTPAARQGRCGVLYNLLSPLFEPGFVSFRPEITAEMRTGVANRAGIVASIMKRPEEARNAYRLSFIDSIADRVLTYDTTVDMYNVIVAEHDLGRIANAALLSNRDRDVVDAYGGEALCTHEYLRVRFNIAAGDLRRRPDLHDAWIDAPDLFEGAPGLRGTVWVTRLRFLRLSRLLTQRDIDATLSAAIVKHDMFLLGHIHEERARWLQEAGLHDEAARAFEVAIGLGRSGDIPVDRAEGRYAVSLAHLNRRDDAYAIAERLADMHSSDELALAGAWLALGEKTKARDAALLAYPKAWADGPPYAFHWDLEECRKILAAVGAPEPELPSLRPEDLPPLEFEAEIRQMIKNHKRRSK